MSDIFAAPAFVDSYAHIGVPRFGSVPQALAAFDLAGTARAVVVLGPSVPDLESLFAAVQRPDRLRAVGIPFGATARQRAELTELQLRAGATGIRIDRAEALGNPDVLDLVGQAGRFAYGIDPTVDDEIARVYLRWLERYPTARLAAPHFLGTRGPDVGSGAVAALLGHPRFFAILSRQGGRGSREPHPHVDLRPWVERVIERIGFARMLWGSEYPVLFWRDETLPRARGWLRDLCPEIGAAEEAAYLGGNADRLFFGEPPPPTETVPVPGWVGEQFVRERVVPLFPNVPLEVPHSAYYPLLSDYLASPEMTRGEGFAAYVVRQLAIRARQIAEREGEKR